jgi:molecular chaperone DnaK
MIYTIEKTLKDSGDKIKDSDKAPIQSAVEKLKQAASGDDPAAINRAIGDLEQAAQAMAQHLYGQGQAGGGPTPNGPSAPSGDGKSGKDDVVDAEFEVKK